MLYNVIVTVVRIRHAIVAQRRYVTIISLLLLTGNQLKRRNKGNKKDHMGGYGSQGEYDYGIQYRHSDYGRNSCVDIQSVEDTSSVCNRL